MKALPYIGLAGVILVAAALVLWLVHRAITRRRAARLEKARRETPWTAFRTPDENGKWVLGVERTWRGHVFERIQTHGPLPADIPDVDLLEAEATALYQASRYNRGSL
jgi:hypothetical protein